MACFHGIVAWLLDSLGIALLVSSMALVSHNKVMANIQPPCDGGCTWNLLDECTDIRGSPCTGSGGCDCRETTITCFCRRP